MEKVLALLFFSAVILCAQSLEVSDILKQFSRRQFRKDAWSHGAPEAETEKINFSVSAEDSERIFSSVSAESSEKVSPSVSAEDSRRKMAFPSQENSRNRQPKMLWEDSFEKRPSVPKEESWKASAPAPSKDSRSRESPIRIQDSWRYGAPEQAQESFAWARPVNIRDSEKVAPHIQERDSWRSELPRATREPFEWMFSVSTKDSGEWVPSEDSWKRMPSTPVEEAWYTETAESDMATHSPVDIFPLYEHLKCVENGLYPLPGRYDRVVRCSDGEARVLTCPPGLHFDNETGMCDTPCSARADPELESSSIVDICYLPKVVGPCRERLQRYYYDTVTRKCVSFLYGGCHGNGNNFKTREGCESRCEQNLKDSTPWSEVCMLPKDQGPHDDYTQRYYYNMESRKCEEFQYGGYLGNGNNFETKEECEITCQINNTAFKVEENVCDLPKDQGWCFGYFRRYYFDREDRQCKKFLYGGCKGNENNFRTKEECESSCLSHRSTHKKEPLSTEESTYSKCYPNGLSPHPTDCGKFVACALGRAYDMVCPGGLHFSNESKACMSPCDAHCDRSLACKCNWSECYDGEVDNGEIYHSEVDDGEVDCGAIPDAGPCTGAIPRLYYDRKDHKCKFFAYGGCEGNSNNFDSMEECVETCSKRLLEYTDFRCPSPNGKFAELFDCSVYYECKDGVSKVRRCGKSEAFDHLREKCVDESEAKCVYHCRDPEGVYPYHASCKKYIKCHAGVNRVEQCPERKAFDRRSRQCIDEDEVPCPREE